MGQVELNNIMNVSREHVLLSHRAVETTDCFDTVTIFRSERICNVFRLTESTCGQHLEAKHQQAPIGFKKRNKHRKRNRRANKSTLIHARSATSQPPTGKQCSTTPDG